VGDWKHGKPLNAVGLAHLLKPFGICPRTIRMDSATPKGYLNAAERALCDGLTFTPDGKP
jgi:hypothetical protein